MSALTAEEMGRLHVPLAALPGLDPVGLWVTHPHYLGREIVTACANGWVGLGGDDMTPSVASGATHLDLADASTADRVARWLASRVGLEVGCCAPMWRYAAGQWWLYGTTGDQPFAAELNPQDARRIPDGSRWVDRAALALTAIAVGGAT